jgi:hypothetical protein
MYHTTLILILSFFTLDLTNKCWAQEPTLTTDTKEIITPIPSIDVTDGSTTYIIGETTTFATPGMIPVTIETLSAETPSETLSSDLISETTLIDPLPDPSAHGSLPESTPLDPIRTTTPDFTITLDRDIYEDCDEINITWSGTDISPPYFVSYYTGTGDIGDTSILGPEDILAYGDMTGYSWMGPRFGFSK